MLELKNVSAGYGKVEVVHNFNLNVNQHEMVALVGANGAGKSTIVNAISGIIKPRSGSISFLNQDITKMDANDIVNKGLIQIPEGRQLFPDMTVEENLILGGINTKDRKDRDETLNYVYELFPRLLERKKQISKTLSGGEQQMVAVGRALMSKPKLLICDEISIGLAPMIISEMFEVLNNLNDSGLTILLIEQNIKRSLAISKRAYVMENGKIVLQGDSSDLIKDPHVKEAYLGI